VVLVYIDTLVINFDNDFEWFLVVQVNFW